MRVCHICPTESKACTIIFVHWTMMVFGMQTKYKYLNSVLLILKVIRMAVISWVQFFLLPLVWKRLWYQTTVYIEFFTKNITLCIKKKKKTNARKENPTNIFSLRQLIVFSGNRILLLILKFFQKVLKRAVMALSQMFEISGSIPSCFEESRKNNSEYSFIFILWTWLLLNPSYLKACNFLKDNLQTVAILSHLSWRGLFDQLYFEVCEPHIMPLDEWLGKNI